MINRHRDDVQDRYVDVVLVGEPNTFPYGLGPADIENLQRTFYGGGETSKELVAPLPQPESYGV
jgi:hypothetical protein